MGTETDYLVVRGEGNMKKNIGHSFLPMILIALLTSIVTGCTKKHEDTLKKDSISNTEETAIAEVSGLSENEAEEESFLDIFEQEDTMPKLEVIYSEGEENPALATFLQSYFMIPQEYQEESRYYYNYVDLDEDGEEEIVALVVSDAVSDSTGETVLLLEKEADSFCVIDAIHSIRTPVIICDNMTNGWHDIIFHTYGGGMEAGYYICHYSMSGIYSSEENEFREEIDATASGRQILSNNLIDDMDKGNYLCLYPLK